MSPSTVRLAAASLLSVGGFLATGLDAPPANAAAWLVVAAPFVAAALMWVPRLEAQLMSRAILWGFLFWASFGSLVLEGGSEGTRVLLSLGLGTAGALLVLPSEGLEQTPVSKAFVPVAFRSVIVLVLILAMTDALVLGLNFIGITESSRPPPALLAFFGIGGALMTAAVFGLLRMRAWGFGLNLLTNVGVAAAAWALDDVPWQLALGLSTTAALQILVGLPLARRIARPGAADPSPTYRRFGRASVGLFVLVLVAGRVVHGA